MGGGVDRNKFIRYQLSENKEKNESKLDIFLVFIFIEYEKILVKKA